jgi:hypothetical protein
MDLPYLKNDITGSETNVKILDKLRIYAKNSAFKNLCLLATVRHKMVID